METLYTLVTEIFAELTSKHHLAVINKTNSFLECVDLVGDKCIIELTYRHGEIGCIIIDPKSPNRHHQPYQIFTIFYKEEDYPAFDYVLKNELNIYNDLFLNKLSFVLKGGFSWVTILEERNTFENQKVEFVMRTLGPNHAIYKKLMSGDLTWREDLESYSKI